jgi:hypothetical protein
MTRLLTGLDARTAPRRGRPPRPPGRTCCPVRPAQDHAVFLTGGTVHTVSGETIENGVVGFNDGAITMVGDASVMQIIQLAPGTEIVDVSGHHVYPGLFAAHTQLGLTETSSVRATRDSSEIGSYNPEVRAAVAVNPDSTLLPVARLNGIMLAGVMPTGGRIAGRASVIRLDGWTWEDMTVRGDAGMLVNWPGVRANPGMWRTSPEGDAVSRVQRSLDACATTSTTRAAYAVARAADASHPKDLRLEAMTPYLGGDHADEGAGLAACWSRRTTTTRSSAPSRSPRGAGSRSRSWAVATRRSAPGCSSSTGSR